MSNEDKDTVAENLVKSWVKILKEAGYSYDEMIIIFRTAKLKADCLIAKAQL
ncbi:hypothetical protein H9I45_14975 [Polaribacter haliotis]|uniref:Uncharacterized protein n=1 Tax=Polaribacter haliotis TaxID=1888915 RepID=A0A7L8AF39_9FLAO|nr:hypothetical protein [Polaribacter haliotis]QOD60621.1 hypothetical protein H9I45_14975 [Polaribacter haliotis]